MSFSVQMVVMCKYSHFVLFFLILSYFYLSVFLLYITVFRMPTQ